MARYSWYVSVHCAAETPACATAAGSAGDVTGSGPEPSSACSWTYCAGVKPAPPTGLSGPLTPLKTPLAAVSCAPAFSIAAVSCQAGTVSL